MKAIIRLIHVGKLDSCIRDNTSVAFYSNTGEAIMNINYYDNRIFCGAQFVPHPFHTGPAYSVM